MGVHHLSWPLCGSRKLPGGSNPRWLLHLDGLCHVKQPKLLHPLLVYLDSCQPFLIILAETSLCLCSSLVLAHSLLSWWCPTLTSASTITIQIGSQQCVRFRPQTAYLQLSQVLCRPPRRLSRAIGNFTRSAAGCWATQGQGRDSVVQIGETLGYLRSYCRGTISMCCMNFREQG